MKYRPTTRTSRFARLWKEVDPDGRYSVEVAFFFHEIFGLMETFFPADWPHPEVAVRGGTARGPVDELG